MVIVFVLSDFFYSFMCVSVLRARMSVCECRILELQTVESYHMGAGI